MITIQQEVPTLKKNYKTLMDFVEDLDTYEDKMFAKMITQEDTWKHLPVSDLYDFIDKKLAWK